MKKRHKYDEANRGCNYIKQQIVLLTFSEPKYSLFS
jgi:hypothetical protein